MSLEEDHAQAYLSLLTGNAALLHVFDGRVDEDPVTKLSPDPPYVLAYITISRPFGDTANGLDMASDVVKCRATLKCVGGSAAAARVVGMQVRTSLLDQRPVIAGRICGPIHEDNQPAAPERDESTDRLVMVQNQDYVFTSTG